MANISIVFLIAFSLALDAFAVSVAAGSYFVKATSRQKFRLSFHFGLFQAFMPIIGWFAGATVVNMIKDFDHWVAFLLLAAIGGKMIYDGVKGEEEKINKDISKGWSLIALSVGTSIDALAVGFSIGIMGGNIVFPSILIGVVAAAMSLIGIKAGEIFSTKFGDKMAIVGGIVLFLIGSKIVVEHLQLI